MHSDEVYMDSPDKDGESKTAEDKEATNWLIQTTNAGGRRQGMNAADGSHGGARLFGSPRCSGGVQWLRSYGFGFKLEKSRESGQFFVQHIAFE